MMLPQTEVELKQKVLPLGHTPTIAAYPAAVVPVKHAAKATRPFCQGPEAYCIAGYEVEHLLVYKIRPALGCTTGP